MASLSSIEAVREHEGEGLLAMVVLVPWRNDRGTSMNSWRVSFLLGYLDEVAHLRCARESGDRGRGSDNAACASTTYRPPRAATSANRP